MRFLVIGAGATGIIDVGRYPSGVGADVETLVGALARSSFSSIGREDIRRWKWAKLVTNLGNAIEAVEDRVRRGDHLDVQPIDGSPRPGGSSWQSLARVSGAIETDYLNGEIVLLGRELGVPTPVNEALVAHARRLATSGAPPGTVDECTILSGT